MYEWMNGEEQTESRLRYMRTMNWWTKPSSKEERNKIVVEKSGKERKRETKRKREAAQPVEAIVIANYASFQERSFKGTISSYPHTPPYDQMIMRQVWKN